MNKGLEHCRDCDEPTGNAGKAEDSLYCPCGEGPYCEPCFDNHKAECHEKALLNGSPEMKKAHARILWYQCCTDVVGCDGDGNECENLTKLGTAAISNGLPTYNLHIEGEAIKVATFLRKWADALVKKGEG